ncbi:TRAP transporter large permease [Thermovenabulum gondwanense]|uniref:Sialic acid TRAP transporter permease protein SiaT n=1 Tax=Thermovenabulum gondwanense TaxID=520767 RepID=A0A162MPV2_9FIRM|nr:TRAP transporter large permease [Thermovenabulum gondwanense]KYO66907.1 Sialic acid TRAP transporter permease protein SiaT [Thermovenabulum gondwanense]
MTGILFGSFAILVILGLPIAVVLGLSSILALSISSKIPLMVVAQRMFTASDSFPLMAIPFFMMAGSLMETGGISKRLINLANKIVGGLPGGLALVGIVTCMFFAAISGSGPATVAAIGSILIPAMVEAGYDLGFAAAVMAAAGAIGVIIPPSIPMVTYGVVGGVSIGSIFLGGFGSGIVVGLSLMIVAYVISKARGYKGSEKRTSLIDLLKAVKDAFWALLMPVIILGGIYGGIFTPTEAAAVAVVYGFIVGFFIYRELKVKDLPKIFVNTAVSTSVVMFIISTAQVFGWIMTSQRIPEAIARSFINLSNNPYVILLLVNILLLIVGCFMETNAAIIILAPIFIPLMIKIGVDPILFGIVMVVNLAIGMITPPLGVNLFVACGIGKLTLERISKAVVPFILAMVIALMLVTYIPDISMFLPKMLMGNK